LARGAAGVDAAGDVEDFFGDLGMLGGVLSRVSEAP
jgi:hypothetical protein